MITYSIIIPHKNIPKLLQRCLDSIPERDDIQVLVADDNSSPEKVDFAHFPGSDRKDVELIMTKEGRGAGYARNCALEKAKGRWLLFADADDFFVDGFLNITDRFADSNFDCITFKAISVLSDSLTPTASRQIEVLGRELTEHTTCDEIVYHNDVPWSKMISRQMVEEHHLRFDETPVANDVLFSARVDYYASKKEITTDIIYCATEREGSLAKAPVLENMLVRVSVACQLNCFLWQIGREDKYIYSYYRVKQCKKVFGWKGYIRALAVFLRTEKPCNVRRTFWDVWNKYRFVVLISSFVHGRRR